MISPPTPLTISIIIVLSGSTSSCRPTLKWPDWSHVQTVVISPRGLLQGSVPRHVGCCAECTPRNAQTAPPKATKTLVVAIQAAATRGSHEPPSRMRIVPTSGASKQSQEPAVIAPSPAKPAPPLLGELRRAYARSPAQLRERVDVERQVPAVERHNEAEPDADLRGRDCHHGEREDLARAVVPVARERDQREVAGGQHQLEREQHDERVAAGEEAERADPEQHGGDRDVPGDVRAVHQVVALGVCDPRITPPH